MSGPMSMPHSCRWLRRGVRSVGIEGRSITREEAGEVGVLRVAGLRGPQATYTVGCRVRIP